MDKYKETFETWNKLANLYQDKFMDMDLYNESYDHFCNSVKTLNAKILEIGCGPGNITKYLLGKRPDFDIFGIDIAPNMVALAKVNNPSANFTVMDCRHIDTLDATYDGVVCGFCLPYLSPEECAELIVNARDLLNDSGSIYLSFVEGDPKKSDFKVGVGGRVYFHFHRLEDIKKQLSKMNFEGIEIFKVNFKTSETEFDVHTIVMAKKKTMF